MMLLDTTDPLLGAIPAEESVEWSSTGRLTWMVYLNPSTWLHWIMGFVFFAFGTVWLLFAIKQLIKRGLSDDPSFFTISIVASLLTVFGSLSFLRQIWLKTQDIRFRRCVATAVKLYIWSPHKGLKVTYWRSLPVLKAQFFASGVFSLYCTIDGRSVYLFEHIVGDATALQQLNRLRWRALETYH